ncbi:DUF3099 domain-containing protein [Microbacterium sp. C7(2022)]|uniref:DUF3099 domain-containing protein n=1 Tax=Microbacterium sp. C7(2022) TaxID=2992759 RepID=UPI00237C519D|nr:DUF3099 domain-containing protein [Microbacterium sp. C7(2022)]MDE0546832.1 DUF3099 domain-containing protein [Microbacterium sp. C7(2022)]
MKSTKRTPSATSLPRAPRDDAGARSKRYLIMMSIRLVCFILMVVITPYGWQTWLFGAAAIFLPYVAVVSANNGEAMSAGPVENPERMLEARGPERSDTAPEAPAFYLLKESDRPAPPSDDDAGTRQ